MAELDNANPTILSAEQLPSRNTRAAPRKGPDSKYADIIFSKPSYLEAPFCDDFGMWQTGPIDSSSVNSDAESDGDSQLEPIDEQEIYGTLFSNHTVYNVRHLISYTDLIATITDPEHPVSLGQLSVINLPDIKITPSPALGMPDSNKIVTVFVEITPTITHCSLATVLGLAVRVRLEQALPPNYRVDVRCKENSHTQDDQVNKQLADKERVAAALENDNLKSVLDTMLASCV